MATVLLHTYSPGPGRGILLNPSPSASPAHFPTSLPALVPSNSSLSSSASSSAPGEDYFSSKSSSPSPGPSSSGSPAPRNSMHLHPKPKRHGSNPTTVRRIRFAPLPEPRRDLDSDDLPPVFDEDSDLPQSNEILSLSSALAAATLSLAAPGDSDLSRRTRSLPCSVTSSPTTAKKALPGDSLLLDPSCAQSASASDPAGPTGTDAHHTTAPSDLGQEWDVLPPSSPGLPALALSAAPDSPRKTTKWSKMLKPLLGRSHHGSSARSSLTRTTSAEEIAAMNGERGRGLLLGLAGSRNSSRSRDASGSRERDQGRDRREADFGLPLHRWTSEGQPVLPVSKKKKHSLFGGGGGGGVPLGRTQSLTSLSSKDDRKALKPVMATNGGRKQQRMLNGRVYGAKRNANPFANVRSEEPEFVEWGYGGMGSVKTSAGQSEIWQRVQTGSVAIGGGDENPSWGARSSSVDEDDGSGMTWLKKRREQREREKKEREEKEKAEAEAEAKADVEAVEEKSEDVPEVKVEDESKAEAATETAEAEQLPAAPTSANATLTSTPAPSTPVTTPSHEEHITQTVNIPAPHKRHHHSHSHSYAHTHGHHHHGHSHSLSLTLPHPERRESADTARGVPFASLTPAASATPTGQPETVEDVDGTPILAGARLRTDSLTEGEGGESLSSSATSTTSTTSDEVDDSEESPRDTEGGFPEDDEEEEEMLKQDRKTAVSAGMEKIARHKEHDHAHEQAEAAAEASS